MQGGIPIPDLKEQRIILIISGAVIIAFFLGAVLWPYFQAVWEELKLELKKVKR